MSLRVLLAIALAAFVALGFPDGTLGVAWPSMRADLGRPVSALGVLLVAQMVAYLVVSAANGALVDRLGTGRLLVAASGASVVGLGGYALASPWPVLVAASVVVGGAGGAVDAGLNAHVAVHHGRRAMGLLHAAFGIGATSGPLLVTALLRADGSWRSAYAVLVVLQACLLAAFLVTRRDWRAAPGERAGITVAGSAGRPSRRGTAVVLAAFLVYTGLEIATGQWAFSFLTEHRAVAPGAAGAWVAAYWAALTVGRLALVVGAHRVDPDRVLAVAVAGAVAGTVALWLDAGGMGEAALLVIGLSLAPVFPTLVSLTPDRFGPAQAARAIGRQLAAAGVGAVVLPGAVAVAIGTWGLDALGPALVLMALSLLAVQVASPHAGPSEV